MALYSYAKTKSPKRRRLAKFFSLLAIVTGIGILLWVLFPIITFELYYAPKFDSLISPLPGELLSESLEGSIQTILGVENVDYTKASAWFPKATNLKVTSSSTQYTLSIPKLGIDQALVIVGGDDLSKSLIHFTGPLPGNFGTPVIFGHSTLLWFYDPKNYKSIFSKLPELVNGDEIITTVDGIVYRYRVFSMKIVSPDDLSVLTQRFDNAYLTLVTCVPPGTYLKRLVVRARLESI